MIEKSKAQEIFESIFKETDGYEVSRNARLDSKIDSSEFLYGELPFETWQEILDILQPKDGDNFFDLGSGTGRVVIQSYLSGKFNNCVGVEFLEGLYNKSQEKLEDLKKIYPDDFMALKNHSNISLIHGDLFNTDLRNSDIIFMNHPFKEGDNFNKLEKKLISELKPGTKIVTTIRKLQNPKFKNYLEKNFQFSWGESSAYFFELI